MIFLNEGIAGLFKGLGPNVMGVFPSRAIYFGAYSSGTYYFRIICFHGKFLFIYFILFHS